MKKIAVFALTIFFLEIVCKLPECISPDFYLYYQKIVEFLLIYILAGKFTDWVFGDRDRK